MKLHTLTLESVKDYSRTDSLNLANPTKCFLLFSQSGETV